MTLSMLGHVSGDLSSGQISFVTSVRTFVDGIETLAKSNTLTYQANIQPMSAKEVQHLGVGLERIRDYRKIYINSGDLNKLDTLDYGTGHIEMLGHRWKVIFSDIRPNRNYCKLVVAREELL